MDLRIGEKEDAELLRLLPFGYRRSHRGLAF